MKSDFTFLERVHYEYGHPLLTALGLLVLTPLWLPAVLLYALVAILYEVAYVVCTWGRPFTETAKGKKIPSADWALRFADKVKGPYLKWWEKPIKPLLRVYVYKRMLATRKELLKQYNTCPHI
jgi:hypothetical protein